MNEQEENISRICKKCGIKKSLEEFVKNKGCLLHREYTCKDCERKRRKEWEENNKEYMKKYLLYWKRKKRLEFLSEKGDIEIIENKVSKIKCTVCGNLKSIYEFAKEKDSKFGVRKQCKLCRNKQKSINNSKNLSRYRQIRRNWRIRNKAKERFYNYTKHKVAKRATPSWANKEHIKIFYEIAALYTEIYDEPYEVDHIVPLQGKNVCGLHAENNLQVITAFENRSKHNKF